MDFWPAPEYLEMMERLRVTILAKPEQVAQLKATNDFNTAYDFYTALS